MATQKSTTPASPTKSATIKPPNFGLADIYVVGEAPLVIHRFSTKTKQEMKAKMEAGKTASSRKNREPKKTDDLYQEARYISKEGWDGFHAGAVRKAMISACRLVGFKMTLARLSLFTEADGWDAKEPEIPLIRIYGEPQKLESMARVATGDPYVAVRSCYSPWKAKIRVRFDADQFTIDDVVNLVARVGLQVGLCEGRPDSKNSAGMGWGLFRVADKADWDQV